MWGGRGGLKYKITDLPSLGVAVSNCWTRLWTGLLDSPKLPLESIVNANIALEYPTIVSLTEVSMYDTSMATSQSYPNHRYGCSDVHTLIHTQGVESLEFSR